MAKLKGTDIDALDMVPDALSSFSPDNSPGMRARLDAMAQHPKGAPLNALGQEVPDPTPMAPPIGYKPSVSLRDQIREMIRSEALAAYADSQDVDTFEEADDFNVEDDESYDPQSPWELEYEPLAPGELTRRRQEEYVRQRQSEENPDPRREVQPVVKEPVAKPEPVQEVGGGGGGAPSGSASARS